MKKFFVLVVLLGSLYFAGRMAMVWNAPNSDSTARVSLTIERGASLPQIARQLHEREVVRDPLGFTVYSLWHRLARGFQAGDFIIQRNLTMAEVAEILQTGKSSEIRITIPEGFTIAQIDALLARKSLIKPGEFLECANACQFSFRADSLEGYLFPSTYFVNPNTFSPKRFIERLYNTFMSQIEPLRTDILQSGRTLNELVIMASMIEREAFNDQEMPLISGILWKRVDEVIHLGVDATTRYEINDWKRPLYKSDFATDSPYNTRRNYGLPPTAISNPSLPAFKAALFPESSPYYYYLHDRTGQIRYGRDYDEHNANRRQYLY